MQVVHVQRRHLPNGKTFYAATAWDTDALGKALGSVGDLSIYYYPQAHTFVVPGPAAERAFGAVGAAGMTWCKDCHRFLVCPWWAALDQLKADMKRRATEEAEAVARAEAYRRAQYGSRRPSGDAYNPFSGGRPYERPYEPYEQDVPPQPSRAKRAAARLLGIEVDASITEIQAAFRAKILVAHPDKGGSDEAVQELVKARAEMTSGM